LLVKAKNKHYKIWKKYGISNTILKNNYLLSKNECTRAIRKAKNDFLSNKISKVGKDSKSKWQFLNKILNRKSVNSNFIPDITYNNIIYSDQNDLSNIFNNEYTNGINDKLFEKYPNYDALIFEKVLKIQNDSELLHISERNINKLQIFEAANKSEIYNQIKTLKNKTSHNEFVLCNSFVKVLNSQISTVFSFYNNLFYYFAYIPSELKKNNYFA
jgi:hypothetical protein